MSKATLTAVYRAKLKRERAEAEFHDALRRAADDGHSLRTIAEFAGLSHARVFQILRDR